VPNCEFHRPISLGSFPARGSSDSDGGECMKRESAGILLARAFLDQVEPLPVDLSDIAPGVQR
jgi:hypothetical protein